MLLKREFKRGGEDLILFQDDDFVVDEISYDRSLRGDRDDGQVIQVMFQLKRDYLVHQNEEDEDGYVQCPSFSSPMVWLQDSFICRCKRIGCPYIHEPYDGRSSP